MARIFNWNIDARHIADTEGPQNPARVYCFDIGGTCWQVRLKPGKSLSLLTARLATAVFKVKYYD